jgi:hypothetical protein
VGGEGQSQSDATEVGDRGRAARQRAVAPALARAALLEVDLGRPGEAPAVVRALGSRRGARPEVVAEATRLLGRALADPVIQRARRASWLARDVPVAVDVAGVVTEERLDIVFEEPGGLVVVRAEPTADPVSAGVPADALATTLGGPVREVVVLSLAGV